MKERRKFKRHNLLIEVKYESEDGNIKGYCFTQDLGKGGLGLPLDRPISRHTKLKIEIKLPYREKVFAMASVAWIKKNKLRWKALYSAGLRFDEIDSGLLERSIYVAKRHQWHKSNFEKE